MQVKYAVEGLTDTMRQELLGTNISLITLNTGPVISNIRKNSMMTVKNIDLNKSIHLQAYKKIQQNNDSSLPFNMDTKRAAKAIEKIILSRKPKPRYNITGFSIIASILKRTMSTRFLDKILNKF